MLAAHRVYTPRPDQNSRDRVNKAARFTLHAWPSPRTVVLRGVAARRASTRSPTSAAGAPSTSPPSFSRRDEASEAFREASRRRPHAKTPLPLPPPLPPPPPPPPPPLRPLLSHPKLAWRRWRHPTPTRTLTPSPPRPTRSRTRNRTTLTRRRAAGAAARGFPSLACSGRCSGTGLAATMQLRPRTKAAAAAALAPFLQGAAAASAAPAGTFSKSWRVLPSVTSKFAWAGSRPFCGQKINFAGEPGAAFLPCLLPLVVTPTERPRRRARKPSR